MEKMLNVCDVCECPATRDNGLTWAPCRHVFCNEHYVGEAICPLCVKGVKVGALGTSGNVEWTVRAEYKMLNGSVNKDLPDSFRLYYMVVAINTEYAWELAYKSFPMKFEFNGKTYGRTEMRVEIDG